MKKYQEPQAHHWVVLRLLRQVVKAHGAHSKNAVLSTLWLVRQVGYDRLMDMIEQLEKEEA